MGTDVATFARQLREDGIEAAKTEAAKILADARKEAEKIVNAARTEAAKVEKETQARIQQNRYRSEDELRLVARDLINTLRKKIEETGTRLLKGKIAEGLNDKEIIRTAITELLKNQQSGQKWEITLGAKIAKPLAEAVAAVFRENGAAVQLTGEMAKAGFEMRATGSNEVFEVTEESVTETFRKLLSPELKKLLEA